MKVRQDQRERRRCVGGGVGEAVIGTVEEANRKGPASVEAMGDGGVCFIPPPDMPR